VKSLYRFLKSIRLAVVLILLITVLSLLSTLVPQGRDDAFYQSNYPVATYRLVTLLRFERFFSSALFLIPAALFTVNLGVCAVDRFLRRARSSAAKRYGPDLVHIGLLVLIAAGLVTALARQEKDFTMAAGEQVKLTKNYSITLESFEFLKYENGSPKAWISTVNVLHDGKEEGSPFAIKVNHPLRLRGVSVYQTSWANEGTLSLKDKAGSEVTARTGQGFEDGDSFWYFADVVEDGGVREALLQEYQGQDLVSMRKVGLAGSVGPYTVAKIESRLVTGLRAVNDPGFIALVAAVILIAAGLALTFIQKKREEKT